MQWTNRLRGMPFKWAPDESLVERAQRGEVEAFVTLTKRHWETVCRVAWNMLPGEGQALEVAAATFLAVRESREAFPPGVPFLTSLYRVALGESWRRLQDEAVACELTTASRIRATLQRLDSLDRAAFLLREIEEVSLADAATILGITPASVRERTHRATLLLTGVFGSETKRPGPEAGLTA
jgi:RNA polymerase sigma-70 factor (ECF subfamily)